jgi:hypothetical protein
VRGLARIALAGTATATAESMTRSLAVMADHVRGVMVPKMNRTTVPPEGLIVVVEFITDEGTHGVDVFSGFSHDLCEERVCGQNILVGDVF